MLDKFTDLIGFQAQALVLRAQRQQTIASNIANVDTPGYAARDFDFPQAMNDALQQRLPMTDGRTDSRHIALPPLPDSSMSTLGYARQSQPNMDSNTVDMDQERANFADNSVRYEAALRFINGQVKTMLSAIQGQ